MKNLVFKMKSPGSIKTPGSGDETTRHPASQNSVRQRSVPIEDKLLFALFAAVIVYSVLEVVR